MTDAEAIVFLKKSTWAWALANQIQLPTGGTIRAAGHEYLMEPYDAQGGLIVFLKGAQLGFSERAVLRTIHDCAFHFRSGLIYYFPTKSDVSDFSKARFGPMIELNPTIKDLISDTDAANIKRVGQCTLYLRGLRSTVSAKSAPADKLVFDEIDEADPSAVDLALKRLDHSEFAEVEALSTPTIPDWGIDQLFQRTDQRHRQIYCEGCGAYTCLERSFPECLQRTRDGRVIRVCVKCHKELDLGHKKNCYVADFPGREWMGKPAVGFRVSQLHSAYVPPAKILEDYETTRFIADFWNSRLAQAYIDASHRLDINHVLALCGSHGMEFNSQVPTAIGVDIGPIQHHVVVSRKETGGTLRTIYLGTTDWDGLDSILHRYQGVMVMDGLPEPARAKEFAKKHHSKAWACFYSQTATVPLKWDEELGQVTVYQTEAMDASHGMLQQGKVILPRKTDEVVTFATHCHNVARKKIEDEETGRVNYVWVKTAPDDHYRKAFNFCCIAAERAAQSIYSGRDYSRLKGGFARTYSQR